MSDFEPRHLNKYEAYLERKYPQALREQVVLREGENLDHYLHRQLGLYQEVDQQHYLLALAATTPAAIYSLLAYQGYARGRVLHPRIEEYYPRDLNKPQDLAQVTGGFGRVVMSPEKSADIIRKCNLASYFLRQRIRTVENSRRHPFIDLFRNQRAISLRDTAQVFSEISNKVGGPFDPSWLFEVTSVNCAASLDDANIHPDVFKNMVMACR